MSKYITLMLNLRYFNKVVVESITDCRYIGEEITVYTLIDTEISLGVDLEGTESFHLLLTLHYLKEYLKEQGVDIEFDNDQDVFVNLHRSIKPISDQLFRKAFREDIEDSTFIDIIKNGKYDVAYLFMIGNMAIVQLRRSQ